MIIKIIKDNEVIGHTAVIPHKGDTVRVGESSYVVTKVVYDIREYMSSINGLALNEVKVVLVEVDDNDLVNIQERKNTIAEILDIQSLNDRAVLDKVINYIDSLYEVVRK